MVLLNFIICVVIQHALLLGQRLVTALGNLPLRQALMGGVNMAQHIAMA